ncbi:MAG: hypothetical protein E7538_09870 [Ruminococcaceae bacterium]|nr:hypothetical protein [Oscillospiraceae bacterium]
MIVNLLSVDPSTVEGTKSLVEILFTDQLPATLTFISALLGIISQLVLSNISNLQKRKEDRAKDLIASKRDFYLPLLCLLYEYKMNIDILNKSTENFNLYDSSTINITKYEENLREIEKISKELSCVNLKTYFPVNKKTTEALHKMIVEMKLSNRALNSPSKNRKNISEQYKLSLKGYDANELINLINDLL